MSPKTEEEIEEKKKKTEFIRASMNKYTFPLILLLSFFRATSGSLVGLGLPNYLIFELGESAFNVSLVFTAFFASYAITPIVLRNLGDLFTRKYLLIFSTIASSVVYYLISIETNLISFIILRFLEGFLTALFWPHLQSFIPDLKLLDFDSKTLVKNYNFSWNFASLAGFLLGTISVFILNTNKISLEFGFYLLLPSIPILYFLQVPRKFKNRKIKNKKIYYAHRRMCYMRPGLIHANNVPTIAPLLMILTYAAIITAAPLLVSVKFESLGHPSYHMFAISSFRMLSIVLFARYTIKIKSLNLGTFALIAGIIAFIAIISCAFLDVMIVFYLALFILGFFGFSFFSSGMRILVQKNFESDTRKYSSLLEGFTGLGVFISPLVSQVADAINVNFALIILAVYVLILAILSKIIFENHKKYDEHGDLIESADDF